MCCQIYLSICLRTVNCLSEHFFDNILYLFSNKIDSGSIKGVNKKHQSDITAWMRFTNWRM